MSDRKWKRILAKPVRGGGYHWHEYSIPELLPPADGGDPLVLLLGCGDGGEKPYLAKSGYRTVGIDIRILSGGADVLADAHDLPLADSSIDVVLSMQVFEHLRAPWVVAAEVARALRPGGWFIGSVAFLKHYHKSYFHMTHDGIARLLSDAGLQTDRLFGAESLAFGLVSPLIPDFALRPARKLLGTLDRIILGARSLVWSLIRRQDPDELSTRYHQDLPLSFRTFDKLRYAPTVVFRARKPAGGPAAESSRFGDKRYE